MATLSRTPSPQSATDALLTPAPSAAQAIPTPALISAMLKPKGVSDLIFSPGRAPQIELSGQLVEVNRPEVLCRSHVGCGSGLRAA